MLEAIIQSKARIEILKSLLLGDQPRFYLRELVTKTGLPQGSVQRELANLLQAGVVIREKEGRQTYYRIDEHCAIVPELRSMLVKTVGLSDMIRLALLPESGSIRTAFVFGSFARGETTPQSDVDLFVIGSISPLRLTSLLKSVGISRALNPVVMSPGEFLERKEADDHFVTSILSAPKILLIGDEDEL